MPESRILLDGLAFGESPRWRDGRLWLCNWGAAEVLAVDMGGKAEVVARVAPTIPFSIDFARDDQLLILSGGERRILRRREPTGELVTHADLSGMPDKGWNELVVDGRGNAYVNAVGFDLLAGEEPAAGSIALVTPDGSTHKVADELEFPNGMAVTPDNATLICAESYARRLTAFSIDADGRLADRRVWAQLGEGAPDGICIDADGAVWYADVPNRRCARVREGGEELEALEIDRGCFACMLGGGDGRTLFVCAAQWRGPDQMTGQPRTGRVLAATAPAPRAGWP